MLFAIGLVDSSSNSKSTTYSDLLSLVSKALATALFCIGLVDVLDKELSTTIFTPDYIKFCTSSYDKACGSGIKAKTSLALFLNSHPFSVYSILTPDPPYSTPCVHILYLSSTNTRALADISDLCLL